MSPITTTTKSSESSWTNKLLSSKSKETETNTTKEEKNDQQGGGDGNIDSGRPNGGSGDNNGGGETAQNNDYTAENEWVDNLKMISRQHSLLQQEDVGGGNNNINDDNKESNSNNGRRRRWKKDKKNKNFDKNKNTKQQQQEKQRGDRFDDKVTLYLNEPIMMKPKKTKKTTTDVTAPPPPAAAALDDEYNYNDIVGGIASGYETGHTTATETETDATTSAPAHQLPKEISVIEKPPPASSSSYMSSWFDSVSKAFAMPSWPTSWTSSSAAAGADDPRADDEEIGGPGCKAFQCIGPTSSLDESLRLKTNIHHRVYSNTDEAYNVFPRHKFRYDSDDEDTILDTQGKPHAITVLDFKDMLDQNQREKITISQLQQIAGQGELVGRDGSVLGGGGGGSNGSSGSFKTVSFEDNTTSDDDDQEANDKAKNKKKDGKSKGKSKTKKRPLLKQPSSPTKKKENGTKPKKESGGWLLQLWKRPAPPQDDEQQEDKEKKNKNEEPSTTSNTTGTDNNNIKALVGITSTTTAAEAEAAGATTLATSNLMKEEDERVIPIINGDDSDGIEYVVDDDLSNKLDGNQLSQIHNKKKRKRSRCFDIAIISLVVSIIALLTLFFTLPAIRNTIKHQRNSKSSSALEDNNGSGGDSGAGGGKKDKDVDKKPGSSKNEPQETSLPTMSPTVAPTTYDPSQCVGMVRRRKSWRKMTCEEQNEFLNAIQQLKESGVYDEFVEIHSSSALTSHVVDAFLPWHRWYLYSFETALQRVAGYCITLPYWDWDAEPSDPNYTVLKSTTFGTDDGGNGGCVRDGFMTEWSVHGGNMDGRCIRRDYNRETGYMISEEEVLSRITNFVEYEGFRQALEGAPHANVHFFFSGTMLDEYSPNDAIFWLHHVNVDRIWALWQDYHEHSSIADERNYRWSHYSDSNIDDEMIYNSVETVSDIIENPNTGWYPTPREVLRNRNSIVNVQYIDDRLAHLLRASDRAYRNRNDNRDDSIWFHASRSRGSASLEEICPGEDGNNYGDCTALHEDCTSHSDCCSGSCDIEDNVCVNMCQRLGQNCDSHEDCCSGYCNNTPNIDDGNGVGGWCGSDPAGAEDDDGVMFFQRWKQRLWEDLIQLNPNDPQTIFDEMGREDCEDRVGPVVDSVLPEGVETNGLDPRSDQCHYLP